MLVLGFASGIPLQLVYITQSAWLYEAKVPIATIGLMSEPPSLTSSNSCGRPFSTATMRPSSAASWGDGADGSSFLK